LTIDENTKTVSIGSRDWLEASKELLIRSHLFQVGEMHILAESLERSTQFTMTGYENPVPVNTEYEGALLTERLNNAYRDDELEPEEREFLDLTREHFSRLDDE
jgi:hypothetical protein